MASQDDYQSARLAVATEVVGDYVAVRVLDAQYELLTNTIDAYQRSLELTQNLRRGGAVSDLDVAQAATQLHTAQAQLPDIQLRRVANPSRARHFLRAVAHWFLHFDECAGIRQCPAFRPVVPSELWSIVRTLPQPNGKWPPRTPISASPRPLFSRPSKSTASPGSNPSAPAPGSMVQPLVVRSGRPSTAPVHGCYNRANLAAAHAAYEPAVANYRQTVLTAFGEVEDELAAQRFWATNGMPRVNRWLRPGKRWKSRTTVIKAGLVTYLDVATAQTTALEHEHAAIQLEGAAADRHGQSHQSPRRRLGAAKELEH